jgi:hypothetical protein
MASMTAQPLAVALLSTQRVLPALVETTVHCFDGAFVQCRSFRPNRSPCDEQRAMWSFPYSAAGITRHAYSVIPDAGDKPFARYCIRR